jgi:Fur family peroxide stress response transcriptional regulator
MSCGRVDDLNDLDSLALVKDAEKLSGYEIVGHQFYFFGVCPECRKNAAN